jgi:uncharacterized membrane protein
MILSLTLWVFMGIIGASFVALGVVLFVIWERATRQGRSDFGPLVAIGLMPVGGIALTYLAFANIRNVKSRSKTPGDRV